MALPRRNALGEQRTLLLVRISSDRDVSDPLFRMHAKRTLSRYLLSRELETSAGFSIPDVSRMDLRVVDNEGTHYIAAEYPSFLVEGEELAALLLALCLDKSRDVSEVEVRLAARMLAEQEESDWAYAPGSVN